MWTLCGSLSIASDGSTCCVSFAAVGFTWIGVVHVCPPLSERMNMMFECELGSPKNWLSDCDHAMYRTPFRAANAGWIVRREASRQAGTPRPGTEKLP